MKQWNKTIFLRHLGVVSYEPTLQAMQEFTQHRTPFTPDEFWILEHPSLFTLGQAGKLEHILQAHSFPIIKTDRGGQVTYHGPGQLVIYTLIDINRLNLTIRNLVCLLEYAVIDTLKEYGIPAHTIRKAPGIYVNNAKICALGLRIRRGCSYHGLSFNINMDLTPFSWINPCGYPGLQVLQLSDLIKNISISEVTPRLILHLTKHLGYTDVQNDVQTYLKATV